MKKHANDNGKTALTFAEAVDVWLRYWAGQFQHHIAAFFGVNAGRANEVLKEKKHVGSREVAEKKKRKASEPRR